MKVGSEIILYQTEDETIWLTQAQLSELYQTSKSNTSEHIKHIFEEEALDEKSVVREFRTTAVDGKKINRRTCYFYAILSVYPKERGAAFETNRTILVREEKQPRGL